MKFLKLVYLIDDDPIFVFGTKKIFEVMQFAEEIKTFKNGQEALQALLGVIENGEAIPDAIFLDINMPVMNGWEFLEEWSKYPLSERIPLYILTSSISSIDKQTAKQFSVVKDFFTKPIYEDVITKLKTNLQSSNSCTN